ncbi:S-adenosyl-L-methionine-dependent methyltransferase [Ochromonadaceae sp. CCMP2298]|nr:S-adenosyl-L-methionine-dependent methyltransferase [Ochromonadaceae sp. CCMP2298]
MNFVKERDFTKPKLMKHGDLVIVYERHDALDHFYLSDNAIFNNKFGTFHHNDIIGKPFGTKIQSRSTPGWVYMLEPTPELWSNAVHTRTQIVNELDSSVVTLNLDVFPGCVVVESGTGSGCMTMSLARAVHPNGHVHTFEYNGVRAQKAQEEFNQLGVGHLITVKHRDVCGKYNINSEESVDASSSSGDGAPTVPGGFGSVPKGAADAVFLDLPEPWLALDHVLHVLKPGRGVCCYSPCIEQVMKTCDKLRELKFHSIRMLEVRQRPYDARVLQMETLDLGLSPVEEAANNRSMYDRTNEHQRDKPRSLAPVFKYNASSASDAPSAEESTEAEGEAQGAGAEAEDGAAAKRRRVEISAGGKSKARGKPPPQELVYNQGEMTEDQFEALQSRIKNRPVSSINANSIGD